MEFNHVTVLLNETVDSIDVKPGGIYADFTLGGGGHTSLILERGGHVVGIDRDITAIKQKNVLPEKISLPCITIFLT